MSQETIKSLQAPFNYANSLLKKFIEICPDDIWQQKSGGWPVWQQVYHTVIATDFFISSSNQEAITLPLDEETASLSTNTPKKAICRAEMLKLAEIMQARAEKYFNGLQDNMLAKKDEALSAGMGAEATNAMAVSMLAGHIFYHLGSCDAALRDNGLEGVF